MRERLISEFGVREVVEDESLPNGQPIVHLARDDNGTTVRYLLPVQFSNEDRLSVQAIRHICDGLRLPKKEFGLTLG